MSRKKIIIDTDCGSDDAMAIAAALNDEHFEIVLITTVSGNVRVEQATFNVLTTIKMAGTYKPEVAIGEGEMLVREWAGAFDTHGRDGKGDVGLVDYSLKADGTDGTGRMLELLRKYPDKEIDIITLGPLTNIARAVMTDADAMKRARRIVSMATTGFAPGNMTKHAEFNVWQDPDAFEYVINSGLDIYIVGWDSCLGDCILDETDIREIRNGSALGRFCIDCNKDLLRLNGERFHRECLDMADPAAVVAALYEESVIGYEDYHCRTMLDDDEYYGSVRFDKKDRPNVHLCRGLKADLYKQYLKDKLGIRGSR